MAHSPEIKLAAFDLYLKGFSPPQIHAELKRRYPDAELPSVKTIGDKWPYIPDASGKTWSDLRSEAEVESRLALKGNYVSLKSKMLDGVVKIQRKLEERAAAALDQADTPTAENLTQEMYAFFNATRFTMKELSTDIAAEARNKDAMDVLVEALCRVVPNFESEFKVKVLEEFKRLMAAKAQPAA
jgi:phosphoenolpyruvate carboxylase